MLEQQEEKIMASNESCFDAAMDLGSLQRETTPAQSSFTWKHVFIRRHSHFLLWTGAVYRYVFVRRKWIIPYGNINNSSLYQKYAVLWTIATLHHVCTSFHGFGVHTSTWNGFGREVSEHHVSFRKTANSSNKQQQATTTARIMKVYDDWNRHLDLNETTLF
jgi:hypothetical protein